MKKIRAILFFVFLLPAASIFAQFYTTVGYGPSFPLGETKDYIDRTSWRNFNLEIGGFIGKNLSLGVAFAWYGSYQSYPFGTYTNVQGTTVTVTGQQWRYGNSYPLAVILKYYITMKNIPVRPYAAVGLGPSFTNRRIDFGIWSMTRHYTQFGMYPEIGLSYWFKQGYALSLGARYNYSIKSGELPAQGNIAVNMSLIWKIGARTTPLFD
jgi:hypothetical protein